MTTTGPGVSSGPSLAGGNGMAQAGTAGARNIWLSVIRLPYVSHTFCIPAFSLFLGTLPAFADAPARVVSMNLCTDQLAMLLAAPGQLTSVSHLASEPQSSAMVDQAAAYVPNRGGAEQIFLMNPDLVLAGSYAPQATVDLLRGLGIPVVLVPPVSSLAEVEAQILLVGQSLGREQAAQEMVARFKADLAALAVTAPPASAALYYPNGYTTGSGTLADDVLAHTGFHNISADAGLAGGGILPLERLVMAQPQVVVTSEPYPGASRAEEILAHPALAEVREGGLAATSNADWVCGTPYLLRAVAKMKTLREAVE